MLLSKSRWNPLSGGMAESAEQAVLQRRFGGPRLTRAMELSQRFGILAVAIPAILPPPAPFKVFVLLAGVAKVPVSQFVTAVALGRGFRYFAEGWLAVRYGVEVAAEGYDVVVGSQLTHGFEINRRTRKVNRNN